MDKLVNLTLLLSSRPRQLFLSKVQFPVVNFIYELVEHYKARTISSVNSARDVLFKGAIVAFITSLLVWLSILMYIAFYYAYVPTLSHERSVHLKFSSCDNGKGLCSFPSAHIHLSKRKLLMMGQPYKILLELEMPESPRNMDLGMFMVCADFRSKGGDLLDHSCRSAMLHYHSSLLKYMKTVVFSPFLLFGSVEEKQKISVELFSDFEEHESEPVTDVYVEVQSRHIEVYSARFLICAHFTGLRYLMFNWPVFSAAFGITLNLLVITLLCIATWYQLVNSQEFMNYRTRKIKACDSTEKLSDDIPDDESSVGDKSMLQDMSDVESNDQYVQTVRKRT